MWDRALEALLAAERQSRHVFRLLAGAQERPAWEPPMDVFEFPERFRITMGLPGIDPESIRVTQAGERLRVTAQRPIDVAAEAWVRRLEIPHGRFQRDIDLPRGDFAVSACDFVNGCLVIDLVKRRAAQR
jgi:HSP20 family protein